MYRSGNFLFDFFAPIRNSLTSSYAIVLVGRQAAPGDSSEFGRQHFLTAPRPSRIN